MEFEQKGSYELQEYTFVVPGSTEEKSGAKVIYYTPKGEQYTVEEFVGIDNIMPGFDPKQQ